MKLYLFTLKNENRYGKPINVTVGVVKAKDIEEAENIVCQNFYGDYSFGLTLEEIKDDEPIVAYTVHHHVFK